MDHRDTLSTSVSATRRIHNTVRHLTPIASENAIDSANVGAGTPATHPELSWTKNLDNLKWNGWGYKDSNFLMNEKGQVYFSGKRYELAGTVLPGFRAFTESIGIDSSKVSPPQPIEDLVKTVPPPIKQENFLNAINGHYAALSFDSSERLFHAHGHTCEEIYKLRWGRFERVPDVVIWPGSQAHVEKIVAAANQFNVVIIPFGGGTSVTDALAAPHDEKRMIVSLAMQRMNKVVWIDKEGLTACIEAGAIGTEIENELAKHGLTLGHEPDSHEFSSLGGWISTRASGMRKNVYGNIEDILISATLVTPIGTIVKKCKAPRVSTGPDLNEMIIGHEGMFGVVTDAVVKVRPIPEAKVYGSVVFPNFEAGVNFMKELSRQRCAPASVRLVDNEQFVFAQSLKPEVSSIHQVLDKIKKWYVTKYKGFRVDQICAATLLFEGTKLKVEREQAQVYAIAKNCGGLPGGEENGKRGYLLTFLIAYLRDYGFDHYYLAESFETSVPTKDVYAVCTQVKERVHKAAAARGIVHPPPFVSCRVTQVYDSGFCIYFYFGFLFSGIKDPVKCFNEIEIEARDEIMKLGGSLSHHHGIGKLRAYAMEEAVGKGGIALLHGLKSTTDPNNVFGAQNMGLTKK
eukprot:TRINITY_DN435_c0_g1_i3.p1 TRINITY_DN435_c0_g1~~TRINITY_DN435_c0_g1_i3.p1  ORF type:complete len:630 (+),score=140.85 TRINITY_DN435_c0_g1_i3:127-2016(+)